jgi:hypothetical protein
MASDEPKVTETKTEDPHAMYHHWHVRRRPAMIGGGLIALFLVFLFGAFVGRVSGLVHPFGPAGFRGVAIERQARAFDHMAMGGRLGTANEQRLTGVVTSVGDNTFTIAGSGSTNTVTTNGSTQYTNGTKASVNDTVVVVGTTSNGTFTATRVVINP